ncbi:MAG: hypothetical protein DSY89_00560 [Deltaproteobacteria bacterium]|nr:MAG: hypothetical protein DSY89_00560 [Deltaproteobacteria bacterium]
MICRTARQTPGDGISIFRMRMAWWCHRGTITNYNRWLKVVFTGLPICPIIFLLNKMDANDLKLKSNPEDPKAGLFYRSLDKNSSGDYSFRPDVIGRSDKNAPFVPPRSSRIGWILEGFEKNFTISGIHPFSPVTEQTIEI